MFRLVLSNVRHNLGRYVATLVAIMTGVAFYAAVGIVSDGVIASLNGNVDQQFGAVDVVIGPASGDGAGADSSTELTIPQSVVDKVLAVPGIEGGAGELTGPVAFLGADGKAFATGATGRLWVDDDELNPLSVESGEAPTSAGQVAVDSGLADQHHLAVGDSVTLLTVGGEKPATVVGITGFGSSDAMDDSGTVSVDRSDAFAWLSSGREEYTAYYARGTGEQKALAEAVRAVVPAGYEVQTGEDFRQAARDANGAFANTLKTGLQAFALLALLVGGFVIYNTFGVIVAQRLRELAVLAALGATPRQLKRSLRLEGMVLGLVGSLLGVAAGYALTLLMAAVLSVFGSSLPGGITFGWTNIVSGLLLGTLITVLSVLIPARRAARAQPIEAMRDAAVESSSLGRTRGIIGLVLGVGGLLLMVLGPGAALIGLGAVAFMSSVFVGAPYLAKLGARLLRPAMERMGLEGRLAADNSVRNPKRTATTANALLIGVFLVTLVAVAGASIRDFAVGEVNKVQSADYLVVSTGGTLDDAFVGQLKGIQDVTDVVAFERQPVTIDGTASVASAGDIAQMGRIANLPVESGSLDALAPGTIAVLDDGQRPPPAVGDTVQVTDSRGTSADLTVAAVLGASQDTLQTGSLMNAETFAGLFGDVAPTVAFVDVAAGAQDKAADAIQNLAALRPDITAHAGNELGNLISTVMDFLINAVTGLLLMSVLIALIGIVNTMSLSILERRRELGLLRIIGMTDKRVKRMVRLESIIIALLGTLGGMVSGVVVSLLLVLSFNRLSDVTITPSLPWVQLVLVVVAGVVLGVLASLLPARRSTRLAVLDAIAAT